MAERGQRVDVRIAHTVAYLLRCPRSLVPEAMRACKFTLDESASRSKQMTIRRSFAKKATGGRTTTATAMARRAADDDDNDDNDGDDDSDGAADDEDNVDEDNVDDDDDGDADNDNLPPRVGKGNDGCDEKKTEEEETVAYSVVIHTTIKQITGRGGGRW